MSWSVPIDYMSPSHISQLNDDIYMVRICLVVAIEARLELLANRFYACFVQKSNYTDTAIGSITTFVGPHATL
jgi:hypothetical protein